MTRKYINVMSKISQETALRLDGLCRRYGFKSKYEILQYLIAAFIRYADASEGGWVNDELRELFDNVRHDSRFGGVKSGSPSYMADHIIVTLGTHCIVGDVKDGKINRTSVQVSRAWDAIAKLSPKVLKKLQSVKRIYGLTNMLEAVDKVTEDIGTDDSLSREISEDFDRLADADPFAFNTATAQAPRRSPNIRKYE